MSSQVKKSSHAYHHAVTCDIHIHMSHSFSYLSSLPFVTDPIAVASNDCARDHLHNNHCTQAFGKNTLSKPHSGRAQGKTDLVHIAILLKQNFGQRLVGLNYHIISTMVEAIIVLVLGALLVVRAVVSPIFGFLGAELHVESCQRSIS